MKTIDHELLGNVHGGNHREDFGGLPTGTFSAIGDGLRAARNFTNGFAAGGMYGTGLKEHQAAMYGDRNQTGFKPGVETGMMFNQALGPVGKLMSWGANALTPGQ